MRLDADIARIITKKRSQAIDPKANVKRYPTPATINRHVVQPLRALLARARKTWKVEVQDIHWTDHLLKEPEERVRELMADEEIRLFASLRPDYHPIVKFALITGCRLQECLDLQWRHFNGKLVICHPDMPPHIWDGEKMVRLLPATPQGEH